MVSSVKLNRVLRFAFSTNNGCWLLLLFVPFVEPGLDWTVEEVFQWCLLQSYKETDIEYEKLTTKLHEQLKEGKQEICKAFENRKTAVPAQTEPSKKPATSPRKIKVHVTAGPHQGKIVFLELSAGAPCMVGRSRGKAFQGAKGLSLSKDCEVSTTHGKFQLVNDSIFFVDTGSTNGTRIAGKELATDVPQLLLNHAEVTCGQTVLHITHM